MPNRFHTIWHMPFDPNTLPLCGPESECPFYYNIAGDVHLDTSITCVDDSIAPSSGLKNIKVMLEQNGQVIQQYYTAAGGGYSFKTDSFSTYDVVIDTSSLPFTIECPSAGYHSVNLLATDSVEGHRNFGLSCSSADYAVISINADRFRPVRATTVSLYAGNRAMLQYGAICPNASSGTVTTTFSGPVTYVSPASAAFNPSSVSGNTITYNITDLGALQAGDLDIILVTDHGVPLGAEVCITSIISPTTADINSYNDTLVHCFNVVNSYDPNEKTVYPDTITQNNEWLTYTIHFQNTGTDTAYSVIVADTLSSYLDAASFQYLASSHPSVIKLFGNSAVFTFPKINLVDSATNPPLSQGWIQYKVKTKPDLPIGTQIMNTAYIYFDLNSAILTNTTVNNVNRLNVGIDNIGSEQSIHLYPNPNKGSLTLETTQSIGGEYSISNMLGEIVRHGQIKTDIQIINLPDLTEGIYTLSVNKTGRHSNVRFAILH